MSVGSHSILKASSRWWRKRHKRDDLSRSRSRNRRCRPSLLGSRFHRAQKSEWGMTNELSALVLVVIAPFIFAG